MLPSKGLRTDLVRHPFSTCFGTISWMPFRDSRKAAQNREIVKPNQIDLESYESERIEAWGEDSLVVE